MYPISLELDWYSWFEHFSQLHPYQPSCQVRWVWSSSFWPWLRPAVAAAVAWAFGRHHFFGFLCSRHKSKIQLFFSLTDKKNGLGLRV
jgi:hypothetical protein